MKEELTKATALTIMGKCSGSIARLLHIDWGLINYDLLKPDKSYCSMNTRHTVKLPVSMSFLKNYYYSFLNISKQTCKFIQIRDLVLLSILTLLLLILAYWDLFYFMIISVFFCNVLKCMSLKYLSQ